MESGAEHPARRARSEHPGGRLRSLSTVGLRSGLLQQPTEEILKPPETTTKESNYLRSSLKRTSTAGQGTSQCLSVMVTTTFCPTMRYSPLTNSWEKRPDPPSPAKMAPFSLAALLALASSEEGETLVSTLKVLKMPFLASSGADVLRVSSLACLARDTTPSGSARSLGTPR